MFVDEEKQTTEPLSHDRALYSALIEWLSGLSFVLYKSHGNINGAREEAVTHTHTPPQRWSPHGAGMC